MKRLLMLFLFITGAVAGTVLAAPVIEVDDAVYSVTIQVESLIAYTFTLSIMMGHPQDAMEM